VISSRSNTGAGAEPDLNLSSRIARPAPAADAFATAIDPSELPSG